MHRSNDVDQTHCENLDSVSGLEICQAGNLLKDPRRMFNDWLQQFSKKQLFILPILMH